MILLPFAEADGARGIPCVVALAAWQRLVLALAWREGPAAPTWGWCVWPGPTARPSVPGAAGETRRKRSGRAAYRKRWPARLSTRAPSRGVSRSEERRV